MCNGSYNCYNKPIKYTKYMNLMRDSQDFLNNIKSNKYLNAGPYSSTL